MNNAHSRSVNSGRDDLARKKMIAFDSAYRRKRAWMATRGLCRAGYLFLGALGEWTVTTAEWLLWEANN